jgi:hypothetical protein
MAITFVKVQEYFNKIAEKAHLDPANSGHGVFWNTTYQNFVAGQIPNKRCNSQPIPIIDPLHKAQSAFYQILQGGWCSMPQMPKTGPFITDEGYSITLGDGSSITGKEILKDLKDWLEADAPEHG